MFTIIIHYFDGTRDQFSNVDYFKFDSLFISFLDYQIATLCIYKVTVFTHDKLVCHWFNE